MGWLLFALAMLVAAAMWLAASLRARSLRPIREAVPARTIAELAEGRFLVRGRVLAVDSAIASPIDGAACVYLDHAEYRAVGLKALPILREVNHGTRAQSFFVDDGTGRVLVHPDDAAIEAAVVYDAGGLCAERRLREHEEVELVASFKRAELDRDGDPYRKNRMTWTAVADEAGPPRVTFRTDPEMVLPNDDLTLFLRGAGALLVGAGAVLGLIVLFL